MQVTADTPVDSTIVKNIREAVRTLEVVINANCPGGRRKAIALTHLETAAMYAVKSATQGDD